MLIARPRLALIARPRCRRAARPSRLALRLARHEGHQQSPGADAAHAVCWRRRSFGSLRRTSKVGMSSKTTDAEFADLNRRFGGSLTRRVQRR